MNFPGIVLGSSFNTTNRLVYSNLHELYHRRKDATTETGIKYVVSGTEHYVLDGVTQRVKSGSCLLVNSGRVFDTVLPYSKTNIRGLCIYLNNSLLSEMRAAANCSDGQLLDNFSTDKARTFDFIEMIYNGSDSLNGYLSTVSKTIHPVTGETSLQPEELFYGIARHLLVSQKIVSAQAFQIKASRPATQKELLKRVHAARILIEEYSHLPVSMAAIAAQVFLSEFHFYRVFKQAYGISPHQYLIRHRLQLTRRKLAESSLTITEIAHDCGFADLYSFSKSFKKAFNLSPMQFRLMNKT